jgi:hypothetical protein
VSARVRVLALDHFFDQDLRALESHPGLDVRRFPYQRLRRPAMRMMGTDVGTGLQAYAEPRLAPARHRYAVWLAREVQRLYLERAFDVIVLPSDTFFYVRALPEAAHAIGVPVVVVQKETTISEATMQTHSAEMRHAAPFVADHMTVCSERHRQFWVRAGAPRALIEVTGQPRFDLYAARRQHVPSTPLRVLFLSYELDAYVPGVGHGMGLRTWAALRDATEAVLVTAALEGRCEVVIKCHPQQHHRAEVDRLRTRAPQVWNRGVSVAPVDADTRALILASDVVIGFQTTALYEAVAAGRSTVYAAWGDEFLRHRDQLIRFDAAPRECVRHATSATELADLLSRSTPPQISGCERWYEEALGPIDGCATERVASRLAAVAAAWPAGHARRTLESRRRRFALAQVVRCTVAGAVWTVAAPVAQAAGQQRRVTARRRLARERRAMAIAAVLGR